MDRLLRVPRDFFLDRSLQTPPLGIAFWVQSTTRSQIESRPGLWSVRGVGAYERKRMDEGRDRAHG